MLSTGEGMTSFFNLSGERTPAGEVAQR